MRPFCLPPTVLEAKGVKSELIQWKSIESLIEFESRWIYH